MLTCLQYVDEFVRETDAIHAFESLKLQNGYLGGRLLEPSPAKPGWRVQVFFPLEDPKPAWLPDGFRVVMVPDSIKKLVGLLEK